MALEAETNKLATKDIEELVQKYTALNDMEDNIRGILSKKEGVLPQGVVREIAEKSIAHKLKSKQIETVIDGGIEQYIQNKVDATEAYGVIAAKSIGEPGKQMTMRTIHYDRVAEIN